MKIFKQFFNTKNVVKVCLVTGDPCLQYAVRFFFLQLVDDVNTKP